MASPCPPLFHSHLEFALDRWRQVRHASLGSIAGHLLTESRRSAGYAAFDGEGIPSRRHFSRVVIRAIANGLGCVVTAESAHAREVLPLEGRKGNRGHPHAAPVIGAGPTASF